MHPDKSLSYGIVPDRIDPESNHNVVMIHAEEVITEATTPSQQLNTAQDFSGRWKDSIFGCFNNLSPTLFMACCCEPCLLGQIAEHLSRNGEGHISATLTYRFFNIPQLGQLNQLGPFYSIVSFYFIICFVSAFYSFNLSGNYTSNVEVVLPQIFLFVVAFYLRRVIRNRSNIRGQFIEDCCSTWLACFRPLAVAQMARHIYRYEHTCDNVYASVDAMPDSRVFIENV